jgi:hypothetical protein
VGAECVEKQVKCQNLALELVWSRTAGPLFGQKCWQLAFAPEGSHLPKWIGQFFCEDEEEAGSINNDRITFVALRPFFQ